MKYTITSLSAFASIALAAGVILASDCSSDFNICAPPGATTKTLGPPGTGWGNLLEDIVDATLTSKDYVHSTTDPVDPDGPGRRDIAFCCEIIAHCYLVPQIGIPMCFDEFTTNAYFSDGTYGSVTTGVFNTTEGDSADLVAGTYTLKDGTVGNIYNTDGTEPEKPDTSTMPMPTPWTSSGVGSAIPATGLGTTGSLSTVTSVEPGTTAAATTEDSITMTDCGHCPAYNTTIPGPIHPASTRLPSTSVFTTGIITPSITGTSQASSITCSSLGYSIMALFALVVIQI